MDTTQKQYVYTLGTKHTGTFWLTSTVSLRCESLQASEMHGSGQGGQILNGIPWRWIRAEQAFMGSSGLKWWNKNASFNWAPQKMKPYGFPPLLSNFALKNARVQTVQQYLRSLWRGTPWFLPWKAPIIQTPGVSLWWPNPVRVEKWDI